MGFPLKFQIDASSIASQLDGIKEEIEKELMNGVKELSVRTYSHIEEEAAKQLKTTRQNYQENLKYEKIAPGIYVITLLDAAMWIEEGFKEGFDMKPGLLKQNTKTSKDGYQYRVIPFNHGTDKQNTTPYNQTVIDRIKDELKARKIKIKKVDTNPDGSPKIGRMHSFSLDSEKPTAKASTNVLTNVSVYQKLNEKTQKVERGIFTFRTVSNNPDYAEKWLRKEKTGVKLLDEAETWASQEWENSILPEILKKWNSNSQPILGVTHRK